MIRITNSLIFKILFGVVLAVASTYLCEYLIGPWIDRHAPSANLPTADAPSWVQDISKEVARTVNLPFAKVVVASGTDYFGHADCDRPQECLIVLHKGTISRSIGRADALRALIAHEYGHVRTHYERSSPSRWTYYATATAVIGVAAALFLIIFGWKAGVALFAAASLGGLLVYARDSAGNTASMMVGVTSAFCVLLLIWCRDGKWRRNLIQTSGSLLMLCAVFYIGVEYRNPIYRSDETRADELAFQVTGEKGTEQLFCELEKDFSDSTVKLNTVVDRKLSIPFQVWTDLHPTIQDRAGHLGIHTLCNSAPRNLPI